MEVEDEEDGAGEDDDEVDANDDNKSESDKSELEEGQVSSDESSDDNSSNEFDDGFDEDLMAGEEDKARLQALPEKERETEIFNRSERRDALLRRWEIEQKIKAMKRAEKNKTAPGPKDKKKKEEKRKLLEQKKAEEAAAAAGKQNNQFSYSKPSKHYSFSNQNKSNNTLSNPVFIAERATAERAEALKLASTPSFSHVETEQPAPAAASSEYFDPKERSKERKKNVEANRTDDKRSNAMAALKAKREGKQKREEEEAKRQAEREGNEDLDGGMY